MVEVSAGGVVFRHTEDGALHIQLIHDRFGKLTLAKGKMEAGETVAETALREILEETGVEGRIIEPLTVVGYEYEHEKWGRIEKQVHYFLVQFVQGETRVQVEEIDEVIWLPPLEAWQRHLQSGYENNHEVLRLALVKLGVGGLDDDKSYN